MGGTNADAGLGPGLRPPPLILRNGSSRGCRPPQVINAQEQGNPPVELSVLMDLEAAQPLQLDGSEGFAEVLLAH